ncbi:hypothetical protein SAMN02949497_2512 [Methylomagnum ishizawai]|uniref:DUF2281 domain-containing protein n=1 Tax=Methylomagnum ishizawai TaxID=1760988 RepID=A0A1Y6CXZ3_9GAMM|nr:hypothetical protein [Methylomagnum ishizawai]SMF95166.1 hypothetical protein SAMN02949497_2512 [Methylomagnum ishizawai]
MYTAIKGIYENGKVTLEEAPPTLRKTKVVVMFLADDVKPTESPRKGVKIGSLAGKGYAIPDSFNEPLEDLSEYQ